MRLTWVGARFGDGRPMEHLAYYSIPARDIDDGELTPEQEKQALDSGLYQPADAKPGRKAKED